jgi:hypothetical protein
LGQKLNIRTVQTSLAASLPSSQAANQFAIDLAIDVPQKLEQTFLCDFFINEFSVT